MAKHHEGGHCAKAGRECAVPASVGDPLNDLFAAEFFEIVGSVAARFPQSAQLRLSDNDFSGSPQPTPTSSQRNTSGRAGWKRLQLQTLGLRAGRRRSYRARC
jgi:hypothetical protein